MLDKYAKEGLQPLKMINIKKEVVALWTNSKSISSLAIRYQKMVLHSMGY